MALLIAGLAVTAAQTQRIQVVPNEAGRRVDVMIDGKPFTSYIWPTTLKKPTLFPLRSAKGTVVTRGYPLEPRKGERVDHPHHVGLWLNHGDVNGLDFWNNSDAIKSEQAPKMGTIVHRRIVEAKGGKDRGDLVVETEWLKPDGTALLKEHTQFVFRGDAGSRTIDRITTLTALGERVVFKDNKEAFFGMRVARGLELPYDKAEVLTDESGKPTPKPVLDNTGVGGQYTSSEGPEGGCRVGHARTLDDADRHSGCRTRHAGDPGQSLEPRIPHVLACARLRSVCRESARREGTDGREKGIQPDARAGEVDDVPFPRADSRRYREDRRHREGLPGILRNK